MFNTQAYRRGYIHFAEREPGSDPVKVTMPDGSTRAVASAHAAKVRLAEADVTECTSHILEHLETHGRCHIVNDRDMRRAAERLERQGLVKVDRSTECWGISRNY